MTEAGIRVSPDAQDWIRRHGGAVMLRFSMRHGCCGGTAGVPVADAAEPADASGYRVEVHGGIRVYVANDLVVTEPLNIRLEGFLGFRRLFVDGAALSAGRND